MNIGLIFAVLTAFNVAVAAVFIRRGSAHTGESFSATAISIFLGIPFFAVAISIAGEWDIVRAISPRGLLLLSVAAGDEADENVRLSVPGGAFAEELASWVTPTRRAPRQPRLVMVVAILVAFWILLLVLLRVTGQG